jgi:predicted enzyme related to lactoylglutathione lyase
VTGVVSSVMSTTTPITGVDFVCVPTTDFERAVTFYGEVLGLPESARWGQMPAAEFETGSLTLAVMQSDAFGSEFRAHGVPIALQVPDMAAARTELEARGVHFDAAFDSGHCHQAIFHDPDGNALALHQRYGPKP